MTFYELLTLRCPFLREGDSEEQTRRRVLHGVAPPARSQNASVSSDAETVCAVAMDPDPARRYASPADLARDLRNVLELRPIEARRPGPTAPDATVRAAPSGVDSWHRARHPAGGGWAARLRAT